jgi:glucose-1-phosphate cytidylyltransferase
MEYTQMAQIDTAVIMAGGKGTRLSEFTKSMPKPLLPVGGIPILVHIIRHYKKFGVDKFIIPVGYLGEMVFLFFFNYGKILITGETHCDYAFEDCIVTVVDTGEETKTGGRLKQLERFLPEMFYMTYGDGISNVNIKSLSVALEDTDIRVLGVVTAVHPPARFGMMTIDDVGFVRSFNEKPPEHAWINGGFFALKKEVLEFIMGDESFENDTMPILCIEPRILALQYLGYWHCIDNLRDLEQAEEDYYNGKFLEG